MDPARRFETSEAKGVNDPYVVHQIDDPCAVGRR